MSENLVPITVAKGDGIGPEIMDATLAVLTAAGARIEPEFIEIGEQVYLKGMTSGISPEAWGSLERTKVFLKAPITTPQGGGYKSLNVTTRKTLGLFANVRPCRSYHPYVDTKHTDMDVVIIRENEEDLYAGIEHRQTEEVYQCLKLISRPGCERIVRYAFEYARLNNRKKVTCFTKDNIMKLTDGLFHKVFDEIAAEYPNIENEHWIIDIGAAKLADTPERFDVIVTPNLYGDVISDIAAQIAGSVGLAGSANIGVNYAMFEAIHGSAPRRAGQNMANPSGLLNGAVLMLLHIGQPDIAEKVQNAYLRTLEDGVHTYDVFQEGVSKEKVGTKEFGEAIIARLGQEPQHFAPIRYNKEAAAMDTSIYDLPRIEQKDKRLAGVDVFVDWPGQNPDECHDWLAKVIDNDVLGITMISNRGTKVWPDGNPETFCTDHWRVRVQGKKEKDGQPTIQHKDIVDMLGRMAEANIDFIKMEGLFFFQGEQGFSKSQGQ